MVNFGTYLVSFRNPAWADCYLHYDRLKEALYNLQSAVEKRRIDHEDVATQAALPEGLAFESLLLQDLSRINDFYLRKLATLKGIWADLRRQVTENDVKALPEAKHESLKAEFHALYVELHLLRDFSSLNYTGFAKILKKHDKTLPMFAMKGQFFSQQINQQPVFGILDELYRIQAETQDRRWRDRQHLYSAKFGGYNRLDTEISFGEALAKATSEIQKSSGHLRKKMMDQDFSRQAILVDSAADHLLMSEYLQGYKHQRSESNFITSVLWQRARVTMMAVQAFRKEPVVMPIITALLLIFIGGGGQSFCLEYMVKVDPSSGSTITFFQFLFVALEGMRDYITWAAPDGSNTTGIRYLRLKPRRIPILYHLGCVLMSWLAAILSSVVYDYHISVPFHMVFKSSILLVNMTIGVLVLRRRYTLGQVASVLLVTVGVMMTTYASLPNMSGKATEGAGGIQTLEDYYRWVVGVAILALSLVFTGFLGILQDLSYRSFGQHWQEALFYAHFLGLPLFITLGPEIWQHMVFWTTQNPLMWAVLVLNTLTSFLCVRGMYNLTGLTSSLTGNLTITVRKFMSLIISVVYFKNMFGAVHWLGAGLVLVGTVLYTNASQQASRPAKDRDAKAKKA